MGDRDALGVCCAIAATVAVGSGVAALSLLGAYPPLSGQAVRYALAALGLIAILLATGRGLPRVTVRDALRLLALAATGLAGFNALLLAALRYTDPGAVGVVVGATPIVLAVAGPLLQRRRPSPPVVAAAAVVVVGAALAQEHGGGGDGALAAGLALALGAMACEAAFSLLALPLLPRLGPLGTSAYACVGGTLLLVTAAITVDGGAAFPRPSAAEAAAVGYLGIVVTIGGFVGWYTALDRLGVDRAGLFLGLISVSSVISVAALGTGELTAVRLAGALLVGVGVTVGMRRPPGPGAITPERPLPLRAGDPRPRPARGVRR